MSKIYEDEFMELQSKLIGLCIEIVHNKADRVYVYGSVEESSISFNAFFEVKGEFKTINQIGVDTDTMWRFLDIGISDLTSLKDICSRYEQPVPTELKLIYDVKTGKLDAKYKYEPICSGKTGVDSSQIFMAWLNEMKLK